MAKKRSISSPSSTTYALYRDVDYLRLMNTATEWQKDIDNLGRNPFWRDYARLVQSAAFRRLKGKTQLFPGHDSDFFRCRLTHSIEVGQIGKSITNYVNCQLKDYYKSKGMAQSSHSYINTDLIEFACYAHDLGHPPFGHQGEAELDLLMRQHGGFEGNAQTLRILSKVEKKYKKFDEHDNSSRDDGISSMGEDLRFGIAPTLRSLAAILKYDRPIPACRGEDQKPFEVKKGYYYTEQDLVNKIWNTISDGLKSPETKRKTIECSIMDLADDIAYSIYDLEDSLKAGFTHPLALWVADEMVLERVVTKIKSIESESDNPLYQQADIKKVRSIIAKHIPWITTEEERDLERSDPTYSYNKSIKVASNAYLRNELTTTFCSKMIANVVLVPNPHSSLFWQVSLKDDEFKLAIDILKRLNYEYQITSPKLKSIEYRGRKIVREIFTLLTDENQEGWQFLPEDARAMYLKAKNNASDSSLKYRIICDFVAGMTDNYALEFHDRLYSTSITSIHKQL
jgi:dGTPase